MITRDDAIEVLYDLINSNVLDDELCEDLQNVANCIEGERDAMHLWGADDHEVAELYTTVGGDEPFIKEHEALCNKLYKKYCFGPSDYEMPAFVADTEESEGE